MKKIIFIIVVFSLLFPRPIFGAMSSTNYFIFADSISSGEVSTSGTYRLEGTAGESPIGFTTSSSYEVRGGYQAMDRNQLSMTISNTSLDLGNLSATQVNTSSTTVSITTDTSSGYALSISAVSGTAIPSVSDSAVTVGQEEYGFSATGVDSLIVGDTSVGVKNVASAGTAVTNSQTVLTFKASMSSGSVSNIYSQIITLTAVNNF